MKQARSPSVDLNELVSLCATDGELFCRTFFPSAFRQSSPEFHREIWKDWTNPDVSLSAIAVFRGGAKTTLLRAYVAWSVAYRASRTIAYLGASSDKAHESGDWLRRLIEGNSEDGLSFAQVFGLRPGNIWNSDRLDVLCRLSPQKPETTISLVCLGITSSVRGLNINSFRPDLVCLDDVQTEENCGNETQRAKLNELVYASIFNTMAPRSEAPNSKMVLLQTPMRPQDLIARAEQNPDYCFRKFGIYDDAGKSRWEERFPTVEVKREEDAARREQTWSYFAREKMCWMVPDEGTYFRSSDLRYYETPPLNMVTAIGIDPVPPPTAAQVASSLSSKDYEAHVCVGMTASRDVYVLQVVTSRSHHPDWSANTFFELAGKWRPLRVRCEGIAYQATLKWHLDQEMKRRGKFHVVEVFKDQRAKPVRIRQSLAGLASNGKLYVHRGMRDWLEQWETYPASAHDDILDATAMAVSLVLELGDGMMDFNDMNVGSPAEIEAGWRLCP
jgi:predicted phage terminase large subunit-like protein